MVLHISRPPPRGRRIPPAAALAAALAVLPLVPLAPAGAAPVQSFGMAAYAGSTHDPGFTDLVASSGSGPMNYSVASSATMDGGLGWGSTAFANAWLRADAGVLRAAAWTDTQHYATGLEGRARATSQVFASTTDSFTLQAAGCGSCTTGSLGTLTFAFWLGVDNTLQPSANVQGGSGQGVLEGRSEWNANFKLDTGLAPGQGSLPSLSSLDGSGVKDYQNGVLTSQAQGLATGLHVVTLSFAFGTAIQLEASLNAWSSSSILAFGDETSFAAQIRSRVDFGHTLAWAGILGVTDAGGQAVTGFTALNSEGLDYAQSFATPVPEPSAAAMLAAGLALLGWLARGRRQGHRQSGQPGRLDFR